MKDRDEGLSVLREAAELPRDVHELAGDGGWHASLEPSAHGDARRIVVTRDGERACWTFTTEADEARPVFYPDDVPFLGELQATLLWDREVGLSVKWILPGFKDRIRDLVERLREFGTASIPREVEDLAHRMTAASPDEKQQLLGGLDVSEGSAVREWVRTVFGEAPVSGLPEAALKAVGQILEFHVERGWVVSEEASGTSRRHYGITRGEVSRRLYALSVVGLTTIDLSEGPGPAAGGEGRPR